MVEALAGVDAKKTTEDMGAAERSGATPPKLGKTNICGQSRLRLHAWYEVRHGKELT